MEKRKMPEHLQNLADLWEELSKESEADKQIMKASQPELYQDMQMYEALKNERLLKKERKSQSKSLATHEEKSIFKPLSEDRMALHQKPLMGNPGLPLELIRERITQEEALKKENKKL